MFEIVAGSSLRVDPVVRRGGNLLGQLPFVRLHLGDSAGQLVLVCRYFLRAFIDKASLAFDGLSFRRQFRFGILESAGLPAFAFLKCILGSSKLVALGVEFGELLRLARRRFSRGPHGLVTLVSIVANRFEKLFDLGRPPIEFRGPLLEPGAARVEIGLGTVEVARTAVGLIPQAIRLGPGVVQAL